MDNFMKVRRRRAQDLACPIAKFRGRDHVYMFAQTIRRMHQNRGVSIEMVNWILL
jgi:hypothetical protein